jgi:hypothetical protein
LPKKIPLHIAEKMGENCQEISVGMKIFHRIRTASKWLTLVLAVIQEGLTYSLGSRSVGAVQTPKVFHV